jgi:hypothetical protein
MFREDFPDNRPTSEENNQRTGLPENRPDREQVNWRTDWQGPLSERGLRAALEEINQRRGSLENNQPGKIPKLPEQPR